MFKTSGGTITSQVRYTYDHADRLILREADDNGNGTFDAASESYVYRGGDRWLTFTDADGEGGASSPEASRRYLHGPLSDMVLASDDLTGNDSDVRWALADHQGSIRDVISGATASGAATVENHTVYDSFGNVASHSDAAEAFEFGYVGKYVDAETGMGWYNARWYDPGTGRFASEDPSGFVFGDANLYRYVGNSPVIYIDPSGLVSQRIGFGVQGGDRHILDTSFLGPVSYPTTPSFIGSSFDPASLGGESFNQMLSRVRAEEAREMRETAFGIDAAFTQARKNSLRHVSAAPGVSGLGLLIDGFLGQAQNTILSTQIRTANAVETGRENRVSQAGLLYEVVGSSFAENFTPAGGFDRAFSGQAIDDRAGAVRNLGLGERVFEGTVASVETGLMVFGAQAKFGRTPRPNTAAPDGGRLDGGLLSSSSSGGTIDPVLFQRMKTAFERNGGVIDQSLDAQAFLKMRDNAGGLTLNKNTILLPQNPTVTAVFEEFIHTAQFRTGKFNNLVEQVGNIEAVRRLEIEAAEKLIRNRAVYEIPNNQTRQTIERLRNLRNQPK